VNFYTHITLASLAKLTEELQELLCIVKQLLENIDIFEQRCQCNALSVNPKESGCRSQRWQYIWKDAAT
jgi:hypothetical protein